MAEAAKSRSEAPAALPTWPDEIYRVLKDAGIRQVAMVPDAGHSRLIRSFEADPETRVVTLTTEEEGVAMLSSVLRSERAVRVNIAIMRAFVKLREILETNRDLARKFAELERRVGKHDKEISAIIEAIRQLMAPPEKPKREIGFHVREQGPRYRTHKTRRTRASLTL